MANQYQVIDEKNWKRAMHCMVFRNSIEPAFCVTFDIDITNFRNKIKEQGYSFTIAMVYAICRCANEIEAFRYRFLDGKVVLFDKIDTAFTYLNRDTELFKVVNVPMHDTLQEYVTIATKTAQEQKEYFTGPLGNDVFQCSPMPWVTYTHISHTISGKKDNATPLFDWGKYYEKNGRTIMPVSVQAHHSFVDVNEVDVSNAVLRERFGVEEKNKAIISRIIKETVETGFIKLADPEAPPKTRKYIPYWA